MERSKQENKTHPDQGVAFLWGEMPQEYICFKEHIRRVLTTEKTLCVKIGKIK